MDLGRLLIDELSIAPPEVVALVGAGGKSTLLRALHDEGVRRGWRVATGTTTRVHVHQAPDPHRFVHGGIERTAEGDKFVGADPAAFDALDADLAVVEADGARSMRVKAPMPHEPVLPAASTLVVAVVAADALDRVIEDVAHRPMRVAAVCGCSPYGRFTVERAVALLTSEAGSRKGVPPHARYAVAITRIGTAQQALAARLADELAAVGVRSVGLPFLDV